MAKIDLKAVVQDLMAKKKYPKKDGGVLTMGTDHGDLIILNEGGKLTYEFSDQKKAIIVMIDGSMKQMDLTKQQAPAPKAPFIPPKAKAASMKPSEAKDKAPVTKKITKPSLPKPEPGEPVWVEQIGYDGEPEMVDFIVYSNIITCECGNIRYIRNSDLHEVVDCKRCTRLKRRKRRRLSLKARGKDVAATKFIENKKVAPKAPVKAPPPAAKKK